MKLRVYCDGGARGNPGPAASAFVVYEDGEIIHQAALYLGKRTNNYAEYSSVLLFLKWLSKNQKGVDEVVIILDSELVTKQLTGQYKVKSSNLKPLVSKVKELENKFQGGLRYQWLSRKKNELADSLVNKVLDEED